MKLGVAVCVWQRAELAMLCLDAIAFARDECAKQGLELIPVVGGSERNVFMGQVLRRGFRYADVPNQPLGTKWNLTIEQFRSTDVDGVVCLGSDDFLHPNLYLWSAARIGDGALLGGPLGLDILLAGLAGRRWNGYQGARAGEPAGCGRFMARPLLDSVCWRPWGFDAPSSLDGSLWSGIRPALDPKRVVTATHDELGGVFDVKAFPKVDVSKVSDFMSKTTERDVGEILAWVPQQIREGIERLLTAQPSPQPAAQGKPVRTKDQSQPSLPPGDPVVSAQMPSRREFSDAAKPLLELARTLRDDRLRRAVIRARDLLIAAAESAP